MSDLPERLGRTTDLSPRQQQRVRRSTASAEIALYDATVAAAVRTGIDQADTRALGDALQTAIDEEMNLIDYGLARANGSAAKAEIVAQKAAMFSAINNKRIGRRFS